MSAGRQIPIKHKCVPLVPNGQRSPSPDRTLDLMDAFSNAPPALDFVWPGFLSGTVGALVAPGATGKSFWALQAAMSVACSVAGGDTVNLKPQHTGRVVYLAGEDPGEALIRRVHAIGNYLNQSAREAIAKNLTLEPILGTRLNVMREAHLRRVIEYSAGARLIVLDTLGRIHSLDENKVNGVGAWQRKQSSETKICFGNVKGNRLTIWICEFGKPNLDRFLKYDDFPQI